MSSLPNRTVRHISRAFAVLVLAASLLGSTMVASSMGGIYDTPTGERAAAKQKCKKRFQQNHNAAKYRKCKRRANLLPA